MSSATVPGIALIVVNILTLYKLKKNTASVSRNDREVTICLIVVSVSFLICVLATGIMVKHGVDIRDSNPDLAYMINYTRVNFSCFNEYNWITNFFKFENLATISTRGKY